jgi:1-deoxy-D-xylulose-5-phosphate reductoisomerase
MSASIQASLKPDAPKRITLLGATGTIGENTLAIIAHNPQHFKLFAASGHSNVTQMLSIIAQHQPSFVTMSDPDALLALKQAPIDSGTHIIDSPNALCEMAAMGCDMLVHAVVGAAGLAPLNAAISQKQSIALANKESLICAGHIIMPQIMQQNIALYPVDSEHNGIYQLLKHQDPAQVKTITLTASGGPFLDMDLADFKNITPAQAVKHPNWHMGAKISIDSATMMNKGLELIEAHYLFSAPPAQLDAIIHPESIIHGMVSMADGSVIAHLSQPDMRIPISYALFGGKCNNTPAPTLDFSKLSQLRFRAIEADRFPLFGLCKQAMDAGPAAILCANAANEIAVAAFLAEKISFCDIAKTVNSALQKHEKKHLPAIEDVLACDAEYRRLTQQILGL